jgi:hypothetical protein
LAHGVVAFSNRPILLVYVSGDAIQPDAEGFVRYKSDSPPTRCGSRLRALMRCNGGPAILATNNRQEANR